MNSQSLPSPEKGLKVTKIVLHSGSAGRMQAESFCRRSGLDGTTAYWQDSNLCVCRMQIVGGYLRYSRDVGGWWWSASLTIADKIAKDRRRYLLRKATTAPDLPDLTPILEAQQ